MIRTSRPAPILFLTAPFIAIPFAAALLALLAVGCGCPTPDASGGAAQPPWLAELVSAADTTAESPAPGTRVWAARPMAETGLARLGLYRLAAADGPGAEAEGEAKVDNGADDGLLALEDAIGNRFELPAALVWPVAPVEQEPEPGRAVLAHHPDAGPVSARWVGAGEDGLSTVALDWNGVTVEAEVELVQDPSALPRRVLAAETLGWAFAEAAGRLWVLDPAGRVSIHGADGVQDIAASDPAPGEAVRVYTWAAGLESAKVEAVIEPGLRYRVRLNESDGAADGSPVIVVPFDALLPAS